MKAKFYSRIFLTVFLNLTFLLSFFYPLNAQQLISQTDTVETTINLSEIMSQAEELSKQARAVTAKLEDTVKFKILIADLEQLEKSIKDAQNESDFFLKSYPRKWLIENLLLKWVREKEKSLILNNELEDRIKIAEDEFKNTRNLLTDWKKTRNELLKTQVGESLRRPISDLLTDLYKEERILQSSLREYLDLQKKVSSARLLIDSYLERLQSLMDQDFISLIKRDESFIWSRSATADTISITEQIERTYNFATEDTWDYLLSNVGKILLILLFSISITILVHYLNRQKEDYSKDKDSQMANIQTNNSTTFVYSITIIFAFLVLTQRPILLTEILLLLFSFSLIVLIIKKAAGVIRFTATSFLILYWIYHFSEFLIVDNLFSSYLNFAIASTTMILLLVLNSNRKKLRIQFSRSNDFIERSLIPLLILLTAGATVFEILGFSHLSRSLTSGTTNFIYISPVILICSFITRDLFRILENTQPIKHSVLAQKYYSLIYIFIRYGAIYLLFKTFITVYSLNPLINTIVKNIWEFGGQFGEFNVTVGGVLSFFSIVAVSWVISVILQILLEGEILARLNLRRGVAMAIGVIVRYSVIVLGFLLAIASTGFDLTKISIVAGALGVGIGFGLQNLVANFISGLILIFERPFVVNDTIETDQIEGSVKEIGIRASKILTYDGAEVIIPNSNLISNRLSNFTLSNASRRELITIHTSVKANPDEVIAILQNIANSHKGILDQPVPFILFDGQTDQSLRFRLYYWLTTDLYKTRSELNLQIYRELKSLGVEVPIPMHQIINTSKSTN